MTLLVVLFLFLLLSTNEANFETKIAKVIHKIYFSNNDHNDTMSPALAEAHVSWITKNHGYTTNTYSLKQARAYIAANSSTRALNAFDCIRSYAGKADLFRYIVVYNEGGWYSDWKQQCLEDNLLDSFGKEEIVFYRFNKNIQPHNKNINFCVQNAFFGATKNHEILKNLIDLTINNIERNVYGSNAWSAGGSVCAIGEVFDSNFIFQGEYRYNEEDSGIFFNKNNIKVVKHKCNGCGTSQNWAHGNNHIRMWHDRSNYCSNNTTSDAFVEPNVYNITILMIASINRPEFVEIQSTYLAPLLNLYQGVTLKVYNESMIPTCVVCQVKNRNYGWWCAQKNLMLSIQDIMKRYDLPDFLYIVDDDTYVNLPNLMNFLKTLKPSDSIYRGDTRHNRNCGLKIVMGGGGSLISKSVLQKLQSGISECVSNIQGGRWCQDHSDWSLPRCISNYSNTTAQADHRFNQFGTARSCKDWHISCHGSHSSFDLGQIYRNNGSYNKPSSELSLSVNKRYNLLNHCHFYIPERSSQWPLNSNFFTSDKENNFQTIMNLFQRKFNLTAQIRVDFSTNSCSKCLPVISKVRPVGCVSNILTLLDHRQQYHKVHAQRKYDIPYLDKKDAAVWRGDVTNNSVVLSHVLKFYNSTYPVDIGFSPCENQSLPICGQLGKYAKPSKPVKELLQYKFLISLTELDTDSELIWMLASNSVVLMPPPIKESWILEGNLTPWTHYVPVASNGSDLVDKIAHAVTSPDQMMVIITNANKYISNFLNFYMQEDQAVDELKLYYDRVHIMPNISQHSVKCHHEGDTTWLYNQLKDCNLELN